MMSSTDEFLNIDTPENVIFGYEVVGIGSRFMAALVDTLIIVLLQIVAIVGMQFVFGDAFGDLGNVLIGIYILLSFALLWGYYIFFEMRWNGSSPGKRTVNLRVIRRDGTPITLSESIIRNFVRLVDFLPFAYGIGIISMFIDGHSRRLGDLAASTLVVREQEDVSLDSLAKTNRVAQPRLSLRDMQEAESVNEWPVQLLTEEDIQLAVDFLARRENFAKSATLANQIVLKLFAKMGVQDRVDYGGSVATLQKIVYLYHQQSA